MSCKFFDVGIGAPLKTSFKEELRKRLYKLMNLDPKKREKSEVLRYIMVESFLCALEKASTIGNVRSSFKKCGIFPFDPSVPLSSQYVTQPVATIYEDIQPREDLANNKLLTSDEGLDFLAKVSLKRGILLSDVQDFNLVEKWRSLKNGDATQEGVPITDIGDFLVELENKNLERRNIN